MGVGMRWGPALVRRRMAGQAARSDPTRELDAPRWIEAVSELEGDETR